MSIDSVDLTRNQNSPLCNMLHSMMLTPNVPIQVVFPNLTNASHLREFTSRGRAIEWCPRIHHVLLACGGLNLSCTEDVVHILLLCMRKVDCAASCVYFGLISQIDELGRGI